MKHTKEVILKSYPEWDMSMPTISPRSYLYRLEPMGIGTTYVESLTSYVARLAEAHCVLPRALVVKLILPALGEECVTPRQYARVNQFWMEDAQGLNGINQTASKWVQTLQILTSCNQLSFLTMLPWSETISFSKLLRSKKAWCSHCLEDWRLSSQVIYEPLLWALNGIDICTRHLRPLTDHCPHCLGMSPFLTQIARPGHCSLCTRWLGCSCETSSLEPLTPETPETKRQIWMVEGVGELLAAAPALTAVPTKAQVAKVLGFCRDRYAQGNVSALARFLQLTDVHLGRFLREECIPCFPTLLDICFNLSITPVDF